jgi:ethanolamine utilization cobalamin adenosyltransferase
MVITESELRQMWRDGKNSLPPFQTGVSFTPSALDFIKTHNLQIRYDMEKVQSAVLDSAAAEPRPGWDRPGEFPVVLTGPIPVCVECGQAVSHKPEHMTQLDGGHFASKTHPRIKLRGQLDKLNALVMLVAAQARDMNLLKLAEYLNTMAAYCREIQSAEYNNRPAAELHLAGRSAEEIHAISHRPEQYLGIPHLVPGPIDPAILHWMNYLRATSREVEILGLEVYPPPNREDLILALNRFSSGIYFLELLFQKGEIGWAEKISR